MSLRRILARHLTGCALTVGGVAAIVLTSLLTETVNGVSLLGVLAFIGGTLLILDSVKRTSRLALRRDSSDTEGTTP